MKKYQRFLSEKKKILFGVVFFSIYLNSRVFVIFFSFLSFYITVPLIACDHICSIVIAPTFVHHVTVLIDLFIANIFKRSIPVC